MTRWPNRGWLILLALLSLALAAVSEDEYAHITRKNKVQNFHDPVALYCPKPAERSRLDGPDDLPVLALYFFRHATTDEEKKTFVAAIEANSRSGVSEYPYVILELGLKPDSILSPEAIQVFNVGRCSSEKDCALTGAMLTDSTQKAQWKVDLSSFSGELQEGAKIQFDLSFEHRATRYSAEFRGSAPLRLVSRSRVQ
ncbi:hypothetical protein JST97_19345 [bacterium]|nr:hypothetical protein [bacterium]